MLTRKPSNREIEAMVHRTIVAILERNGHQVAPFDNQDDLVATGLTSLDLAALVALLERQWQIDPFLEAIAVTDMRTVGDLCRAYQEVINEAAEASPTDGLREALARRARSRE
jgi:acyl carrier protein